jgi:ribokinase
MSADVIVVASFMMDHTAYVSRRPEPGETVRGHDFLVSEGGKGFNQAVAAARTGAAVQILGRLGDDEFGGRFTDRLREEGIDTTGIEFDLELGTGVGLPVVDEKGENAIVVVPGANDGVTAQQLEGSAQCIASAKVLLLQREVPESAAVRAAEIAHEAGVYVVLNPAPAGPVHAFRGLVDLVIPNEVELNALIEGSDVEVAARTLAADLGGCDVIVTLGGAGVLIVTAGIALSIPADLVDAVDTTGAGDCFCGSLAARLATGEQLLDAAEYAVVASGKAVARRGGADSAPTLAEVLPRFLARRQSVGERGVPHAALPHRNRD